MSRPRLLKLPKNARCGVASVGTEDSGWLGVTALAIGDQGRSWLEAVTANLTAEAVTTNEFLLRGIYGY